MIGPFMLIPSPECLDHMEGRLHSYIKFQTTNMVCFLLFFMLLIFLCSITLFSSILLASISCFHVLCYSYVVVFCLLTYY